MWKIVSASLTKRCEKLLVLLRRKNFSSAADFLSSIFANKMAGVANKSSALVSTLMSQAKPKFATFMKYAAIELTPPTPGDLPAIKNGLVKLVSGAKTGAWKNLSVRDAWLNTLVGMEICFWFYVGECIGKRHLVGYKV